MKIPEGSGGAGCRAQGQSGRWEQLSRVSAQKKWTSEFFSFFWHHKISWKCLLNHQLCSGLCVYWVIVFENWQQCALHMVSHPEISVFSNTLSQNFLAKRELTVFVGMALFLLNNHKHYFLSCRLACFRTHLVRKFGGWSPVVNKVLWGFRSSSVLTPLPPCA